MLITILTPTYNRGYIIEKLYKSLLIQTDKNFEWIVVDDGSTDNTEDIFKKIINENKLPVKYLKKENGGKHTALNEGIKVAKGDMLIIVDSDDYLIKNAIQRIREESKKIFNNNKFAGVSFRKIRISDNKIIGNDILKEKYVDTDSLSYRYKYKITGDLAECFKLKVLKEFPFPIYENEKFVPEALVWNRISDKYIMRFFNSEGIYMCEYLPDGYSQQFSKLRKNNPKAYKEYYSEELMKKKIPIARKIKSLARFLEILGREKWNI